MVYFMKYILRSTKSIMLYMKTRRLSRNLKIPIVLGKSVFVDYDTRLLMIRLFAESCVVALGWRPDMALQFPASICADFGGDSCFPG